MYLCQHSQAKHCKDQGEDISDQPLQSLSPFTLVDTGSPPGCTSCWTQPPVCTSLHFLVLLGEHNYVFALFFTEVGCYLFAQLAQSSPLCTYCWTQPPLCNSLHFSLNMVTSLHFFAHLYKGWLLPLCTSCSIFHAVFQQSTSLRWTQNICDAEFHWICICSPISWPSIIFRFSLSRNIYRERCIILIGDLGRGQGSD